jgi:hypothetical protein
MSALGYRRTIGEVIQSLFPHGFLLEAYLCREAVKLSLLKGSETEEDVFSEEFFKIAYNTALAGESDISCKVIEKIDFLSMSEKLQKEFQKSLAFSFGTLPFTPYDLFVICAILLRDSGAYHQIEPSLVETGKSTHAVRRVEVTKQRRKELISLGDIWRASDGLRGDAHDEATRKLVEELSSLWAGILNKWDSPIFDPISATENSPSWWRNAYELLAIADRASRDSGYPAEDVTEHGPGSYEEVVPGGFWSKYSVANLSANKDHQDIDLLYEKFSLKLNIGYYELLSRNDPGLSATHTLSAANRDIANVLPKSRTSQVGCTLRSLTHNLSLLPPRGLVRGTWLVQEQGYQDIPFVERRPFNIIVIPYPYELDVQQFRPKSRVADDQKFGDFEFIAREDVDILDCVKDIIEKTRKRVGTVHGIVFPELSLSARQFDEIYKYVRGYTNIELLCAGVTQKINTDKAGKVAEADKFASSNTAVMTAFERYTGENLLETATPWPRKWAMCAHQKHHRWMLDEEQIKRYGLSAALDPSMKWWEDLRLFSRKLSFLVMRDRWSVTTLICEDLAREDPAQQIVRSVGPNLILSLLMDGPQISKRWSSRYATVLADDPGSAVLTVNSLALVDRSNETLARDKKMDVSEMDRPIALWRDDTGLTESICLSRGDKAACLTIYEYETNEFTLDGRRNSNNSIALRLGGYFTI